MRTTPLSISVFIGDKAEHSKVEIPYFSEMSEVIRLLDKGDPKEVYIQAMVKKIVSDPNLVAALTTLLDRFLRAPEEEEEAVGKPGHCRYCGEKLDLFLDHICPDCDECGHPADAHHPKFKECTDPECDCLKFVHIVEE